MTSLIELSGLKTKTLGRSAFLVETISSTQVGLKEMVRQGAPDGTVLLANRQSKGRGRGTRTWLNLEGRQLLVSIYLCPSFSSARWPLLNLAAGICAAEAVEAAGVPFAHIKWPNDVLVHGKKLAGILAESWILGSSQVGGIILGMGMNLEGTQAKLPSEIGSIATTLEMILGERGNREVILVDWLNRLEYKMQKLAQDGAKDLQDSFVQRWPFQGEPIEIQQADTTLKGTACEIDENGALKLLTQEGQTIPIHAGDVSKIRVN